MFPNAHQQRKLRHGQAETPVCRGIIEAADDALISARCKFYLILQTMQADIWVGGVPYFGSMWSTGVCRVVKRNGVRTN
jgi:hypothetical protein